jgi:RNA polymerase sigma-70 factor (ECF subfamily)
MIFRVAADDPAIAHLGRAAQGDPEGLAELYDLFASRLFSLAMRMLRDAQDSEEVVQDVFAQAWRRAAAYEAGRGTVGGWLLMMTRSRALDRLRARRAQGRALPATERDPDELPAPFPSQDLVAITVEQGEQLRKALGELPAEQRDALELAYFEGLTHPEIADRLSQPLGTVKTRIRLGLTKLREVFVRSSKQGIPT